MLPTLWPGPCQDVVHHREVGRQRLRLREDGAPDGPEVDCPLPRRQEAWSEIRRTGYPKVFPSAQSTAYDLTVPNRLPFDYMEPVNNPDNYQKAVQLLGGPDTYATKMWWQK